MDLTVHLICNAHLDPVWQWRWEEGASEALATFGNAVAILDEHPSLVFCHNEAVLYRWVERYDPALFAKIRRLVRAGRWAVSGGWFIQPDVNLPGTESLIRQIIEGRRYFREKFGAAPRVAYNFDSFGHSGGLPQILRLAGYEMYIHMRPQARELRLPADLYRWRGLDGTTIPAYRIAVGLYHTERDNIEDRLRAGVALALKLRHDVPVFWGLGNHGGGATREDLRRIDAFVAGERRVRIVHSTPDRFFEAVKKAATRAPVHSGDLQRSFTGCYTSLSRLKRRAVGSLGGLVQAEALAAAAWWLGSRAFPGGDLAEAWRANLFNDFHDILTGTCIEPAERDALDQYGLAEDTARAVKLGAVAALTRRPGPSPDLPLTVANANPSLARAPVEFECMADYRPFWKGTWRLRLFRADGREVACQEEQPEALLPFNDWRRRVSFIDDLPGVGVARYFLKAEEAPSEGAIKGGHGPSENVPGRGFADFMGERKEKGYVPSVHVPAAGSGAAGFEKEGEGGERGEEWGHVPEVRVPLTAALAHRIDRKTGLVASLKTCSGRECLAGPLLEPLVIEDTGDSWGTGRGSYRKIAGRFKPCAPTRVIASGPVRTIVRSIRAFRKSRILMDVHSYPDWPVLEYRLRIEWNEERRRLKLRVPFRPPAPSLLCEVPGGAIERPSDGQEHVHGRWLALEGRAAGERAALGIAHDGQHGLDFKDGELRLSVLRSSAYCHERGFDLDAPAPSGMGAHTSGTCPQSSYGWKFADIGVHEIRLLVTAGEPARVLKMLPGLADHLAAPPAAYPHLPIGGRAGDNFGPSRIPLLSLSPSNIRLLACKRSWDGQALILRLQEAVGKRTKASVRIEAPHKKGGLAKGGGQDRGHVPLVHVPISFKPYEIKTVRVERSGAWREAALIEEMSNGDA
jgi:alpha-mannosidase